MPTIQYRTPDGQTQEADLNDPNLPPQIRSLYTEKYLQPQAQLQETNTVTGESDASTKSHLQDVKIKQRQLDQQQFTKDTQTLFDKSKDKSGYISPDLYNKTKQAATNLGIGGGDFDQIFANSGYVNPQKIINYNTAEGLANQQAYGQIKRQLQTQLDQFNAIPQGQKGLMSTSALEDVPVLGQILAPHAYAYEQNKKGLSAQLKSIAGGGSGSGLRVTQAELDRWANLMPSTKEVSSVNHDKLNQINNEIKATFNTPTGLDQQYLPSKGRAPWASLQK